VNPETEEYLLPLAQEAYSADTPKGWEYDEKKDRYFNKKTKAVSKDHPNLTTYKDKIIKERRKCKIEIR